MILLNSGEANTAALIDCSDEKRALIQNNDKCDKYDYLIAVACGAIGGMVDIFLVGAPGDSVIGKWTDAQVDHAVKGFARLSGWSPRADKTDSVASAIGFWKRNLKLIMTSVIPLM